MMGFIYRWRNVVTDWSYIGSTLQLRKRKNLHLCLLRTNRHHTRHLQAAWNKYGEHSFVFEVLAELDCTNDVELRKAETDWLIKCAGSLYNAAPVAQSVIGLKRSDETRAKISLALRGMKRSVATRARISEAQRNRLPSTRNLEPLFSSRRGTALTPAHRAKISEANKRRVLSKESRLRMSRAQRNARAVDPTRFSPPPGFRGAEHSPEAKQKISDALYGKSKKESAVLRQAASLSGRPSGALLRSPDGTIYRVVNCSAFARDHALNQTCVSAVILGRRPVHKGWTLVRATEAPR